MKSSWRKISSRVVYRNKWITVYEDSVLGPDGKRGIYGYVSLPSPVGIVALTKDKQVYLERQYRYPFKKNLIELPRGLSKKGEKILSAAKRELREETGIEARSWKSLGYGIASPGLLTEGIYLFLAQHLRFHNSHQDTDESIEVFSVPFAKALKWAINGIINDEMTIVALFRAKSLLHL